MIKQIINNCEIYNDDCINIMKLYQDKYFDYAIVDPPFGIGKTWKKIKNRKYSNHQSTYENNKIPTKEYFEELFRVSKNQIIWGGNYFTEYLPPTGAWLFWDKIRSNKTFFAQGELAWTSLKIPLRIIPLQWDGCRKCEKPAGIHPNEKPVKLYEYILNSFCKNDMIILDTHMGSGSSAIACQNLDFKYVGCEIDTDYFNNITKRINENNN